MLLCLSQQPFSEQARLGKYNALHAMAPSSKHLMHKGTWGNGQGSGSSVLCKPKSGLMTVADNLYKTLQAESDNQHDN